MLFIYIILYFHNRLFIVFYYCILSNYLLYDSLRYQTRPYGAVCLVSGCPTRTRLFSVSWFQTRVSCVGQDVSWKQDTFSVEDLDLLVWRMRRAWSIWHFPMAFRHLCNTFWFWWLNEKYGSDSWVLTSWSMTIMSIMNYLCVS